MSATVEPGRMSATTKSAPRAGTPGPRPQEIEAPVTRAAYSQRHPTAAHLQPPDPGTAAAGAGGGFSESAAPITYRGNASVRTDAHTPQSDAAAASEAVLELGGCIPQPEHSLPAVEPFPQARRSASSCQVCTRCAYCGEPVGHHDHDHVPIPYRHGGREVVPACADCHRLKDYLSFEKWGQIAQHAAAVGTQGSAVPLLHLLVAARTDPGYDVHIDRDTALQAINDCTTTEARLSTAQLIAFALDEAKRRRAA